MKLILVGVSGFSERWINVLFNTPGVEVAALTDVSVEKFPAVCEKFKYPSDQCFPTLKEAISRVKADMVLITIPTKYHYSAAKEALMAGKHVLVEKPLALTLAQSRSLQKLAVKKNKTLSVVSQHRYTPYLKTFKSYCSISGPLGRPLSFFIRIHMNRPASYYEVPARREGLGVMSMQGVHALDWIHWLFGKTRTCSASIGTLLHKTNNEDTSASLLTLENGIMGILDINHITQGKDELLFQVFFEKGKLQYSLDGRIVEETNGQSRDLEYQKVNPQYDALRDQLLNFVQAVRNKKAPDITARDGVNVMALLDSLYKSAGKCFKVRY